MVKNKNSSKKEDAQDYLKKDLGLYQKRNQSYFPQDITIEDCRDAIKGIDGFRETVRNGIICFNYDFCTKFSFPDPYLQGLDARLSFILKVRRECRGILFEEKSGRLICRKLHKFFNINEMDETHQDKIDISKDYVLLEKLDGSLIAPMMFGGEVTWGSKSGPTEISVRVNNYIGKNPTLRFNEFSRYWLEERNCTPLYEWCSLHNQIILPYSNDCLTVLSIRNMATGEYVPHKEVVESAEKYNVPIAKTIDPKQHPELSKCANAGEMIDTVKKMEGVEGFIIKFDSGLTYKMKTDWYFGLNKTSSLQNSSFEKDIWNLILENQLDDIIAAQANLGTISLRLQAMQFFAQDLFQAIEDLSIRSIETIIRLKLNGRVRKHIFSDNSIEPNSRPIIFQFFDDIEENHKVDQHISNVSSYVVKQIKGLTLNSSKLEEARKLLPGNLKFDEKYIESKTNSNNTTTTTTTNTNNTTIEIVI